MIRIQVHRRRRSKLLPMIRLYGLHPLVSSHAKLHGEDFLCRTSCGIEHVFSWQIFPPPRRSFPSPDWPVGAMYPAAEVYRASEYLLFPVGGAVNRFSLSSRPSSHTISWSGRTFPSNPFMVLPERRSTTTGRTLTYGRTPPVKARGLQEPIEMPSSIDVPAHACGEIAACKRETHRLSEGRRMSARLNGTNVINHGLVLS